MSADQSREMTTDVLEQKATVKRRAKDGMVWLYVPQGMAMDREEAWRFSQMLLSDEYEGEQG